MEMSELVQKKCIETVQTGPVKSYCKLLENYST